MTNAKNTTKTATAKTETDELTNEALAPTVGQTFHIKMNVDGKFLGAPVPELKFRKNDKGQVILVPVGVRGEGTSAPIAFSAPADAVPTSIVLNGEDVGDMTKVERKGSSVLSFRGTGDDGHGNKVAAYVRHEGDSTWTMTFSVSDAKATASRARVLELVEL